MRTQHKSKYLWTAFGTIRWKFRARWGHSWVGACNSCQKGSIEVKLECRSKRSYRSCFRRYNCICQHIQIRMRNYEWLPACVLALWWFSRRGPFASSAWWIICIVLSVIGDLYSEMLLFSCYRKFVTWVSRLTVRWVFFRCYIEKITKKYIFEIIFELCRTNKKLLCFKFLYFNIDETN